MAKRPPEVTVDHAYALDRRASELCLSVARESQEPFLVVLPIVGTVAIGRDPDATLSIDSPSLSRLHFALELEGDVARVRDLGSRNGTLVDGRVVGDAPEPLALGAEILAGDVRFAVLRAATLPSAARPVSLPLRPPVVEAEPTASTDASVPPAFRYPSLAKVHADLRRIAPRSISVLIRGETGTGKEVVAREIHRLSGRTGPLVAVNTAALPENLVESELFGHERGAFSGALTTKAGLIETADKGTLFLDEIGELSLPLQAKLLRVLEDRAVRRVGATVERKVDIRVVAATHQDLEQLGREKKFRQDLLFRLDGASVVLPPLRSRRGEIGPLANGLLADLGSPAARLDPAALALLEAHDFPGNVRELRHVLERALAFADADVIMPEHLPATIREAGGAARTAERGATDVRSSVKDFERERILEALRTTGGNRTKAGELLGLPRRTLVYKLSKMKLDEE